MNVMVLIFQSKILVYNSRSNKGLVNGHVTKPRSKERGVHSLAELRVTCFLYRPYKISLSTAVIRKCINTQRGLNAFIFNCFNSVKNLMETFLNHCNEIKKNNMIHPNKVRDGPRQKITFDLTSFFPDVR